MISSDKAFLAVRALVQRAVMAGSDMVLQGSSIRAADRALVTLHTIGGLRMFLHNVFEKPRLKLKLLGALFARE